MFLSSCFEMFNFKIYSQISYVMNGYFRPTVVNEIKKKYGDLSTVSFLLSFHCRSDVSSALQPFQRNVCSVQQNGFQNL